MIDERVNNFLFNIVERIFQWYLQRVRMSHDHRGLTNTARDCRDCGRLTLLIEMEELCEERELRAFLRMYVNGFDIVGMLPGGGVGHSATPAAGSNTTSRKLALFLSLCLLRFVYFVLLLPAHIHLGTIYTIITFYKKLIFAIVNERTIKFFF